MKKAILSILAAVILFHSGCALFLIGAGAAGAIAISKDEIEGLTDNSYDRIWSASRETLMQEGTITLEDKVHGKLDGEVEGTTVEFSIDQVTPQTVRTRIKARKTNGLFPDLDRAQNLYTKVMRKAK